MLGQKKSYATTFPLNRFCFLNSLKLDKPDLIPYLNRMSDYLFVLARHIKQNVGINLFYFQN